MLIIEVDGNTHHSLEALAIDERRQKDLETFGFTLIRFAENEELNHIDVYKVFLRTGLIKEQRIVIQHTK